ncbi:hypothetical protein C8Q76DRAFT_728198 [Earliella scabrosa]|nr:hypothetical protein C8Q76DRAFT_728198 [Earliella scabrosa]
MRTTDHAGSRHRDPCSADTSRSPRAVSRCTRRRDVFERRLEKRMDDVRAAARSKRATDRRCPIRSVAACQPLTDDVR